MTTQTNFRSLGIKSECSAVAAAIKIHRLHLFCAPFSCLDSDPYFILFHSIGGRCFEREKAPVALKREAGEELRKELIISSAIDTRLYISDGTHTTISISEDPRPFCIINKTTHEDRSFYHPDVHWVIGYNAQITEEFLYPHEELAFLLFLTDNALIKCMTGKSTYGDINKSEDGSKIIVNNLASLDYKKLALPAGLAIILANELIQGHN